MTVHASYMLFALFVAVYPFCIIGGIRFVFLEVVIAAACLNEITHAYPPMLIGDVTFTLVSFQGLPDYRMPGIQLLHWTTDGITVAVPWNLIKHIFQIAFVGAILLGAGIVALQAWNFHGYLAWVGGQFKLAERELNALILRGRDHGGRKDRIAERYEWNTFDKWAPHGNVLAFRGTMPDTSAIAKEFIRENEAEVKEYRQTMGRVKLTAFLLRELLNISAGTAIAKIQAEQRQRNGELPFIASGIWELLGAKETVPPSEWKPVHWRVLAYVVRKQGFPRELVMTKKRPDGTLYEVRGMELLAIINAQVVE